MDGTAAIGGSQALLAAQVATAVAAKAQDVERVRADAAMALLEQATELSKEIRSEGGPTTGGQGLDLVA